jgi:hypothetical protein
VIVAPCLPGRGSVVAPAPARVHPPGSRDRAGPPAAHHSPREGMLSTVTTPRPPRPEPGMSRTRAADVQPSGSSTAGRSRTIAIAALLVAGVALGLAVWRIIVPGAAGCQTAAWDTTPAADELPDGWAISASQYDLGRKTMSLLGPTPLDEAGSQAVVYATVTCFAEGAADSVTRSAQAATDAGQTVDDRPDLGDQAFSAADDAGSMFLQLRHGDVVVYLAASGDATPPEVDQIASAYDKALGGDGGAISAAASPDASTDASANASEEPSGDGTLPGASDGGPESPAAPALEGALPTQVGAVKLIADSAVGSTILGDDQGSRAILAALRKAGKEADALQIAQAYDETGASDLSILGVMVDGMPVAAVQDLVVSSWLSASGAGITQSTVTLDGNPWTRVDYGDGGGMDYVRTVGDIVYVITTADTALAEQAAAALP